MAKSTAPYNIALQSQVAAGLRLAPNIASLLGVSAHEGVLTLSGSVGSAAARAVARHELVVFRHSIPGAPPSSEPRMHETSSPMTGLGQHPRMGRPAATSSPAAPGSTGGTR